MPIRGISDRSDGSRLQICWALAPLPSDLESARKIARDGLTVARQMLGAESFRILDRDGYTLLSETYAGVEPFLNFHR